jgi:iron(III) transport system ATP-binding protein
VNAPALEVTEVALAYGAQRVLHAVSLSLASGELHALLGVSGSGKTTLLRAIAGFEPIDSGSIRLFGREAASSRGGLPPEARNVGVVFQDFALFPHLDVRSNLRFGRRDMPLRAADALLERAGLAGYGTRHVSDLSGGEQQRVALCRALAQEPQLVLFDEPFSNLNRELRRSLRALTVELLRERAVSALFVTHDAEEAFALADRVSVLHEGRLLETGTPRELYLTPSSLLVARSVGDAVVLPARRVAAQRVHCALGELDVRVETAGASQLLLRPEQVHVAADGPGAPARVRSRRWLGASEELELELLPAGERLIARVPSGELPDTTDVRITVTGTGLFLS